LKRKTVCELMLTMLLIGILTSTFNIQSVKASGTIYIKADGSVYPPDAPISTFDNVTYTFTDDIHDSIVVERDNIVVDGAGYTVEGTGSGSGIILSGRSNVTIKDVKIKNFLYGVRARESHNNNISGNEIIANSVYGIYLRFSNFDCISGNNITASGVGIHLYVSSNNNILGNNIRNDGFGINLDSSSKNTLAGNTMTNNEYNLYVTGYKLKHFLNSIDVSNVADGKPVYYLINQTDLIVNPANHPQIGYLGLINCVNLTVEDLTLTDNYKGILLAYTNNSRITNNIMTNNKYGIYLLESYRNDVHRNNVISNSEGVVLCESLNNNITGNNITNSDLCGIYLFGNSLGNNLSRNIVTNNYFGIFLEGQSSSNVISENNVTENEATGIEICQSSMNIVSDNNITKNKWHGLYVDHAANNLISGNSITSNDLNGVRFDSSLHNTLSRNNIIMNKYDGINLGGSSNNTVFGNIVRANGRYGVRLHVSSSNNLIYHNRFENNALQADIEMSINIWDDGYPSGGNYWSDYARNDTYSGPCQNETGSDGIGDTPYNIGANNTDRYPLMGPIRFFNAGIWEDTTYYVHVISNSTLPALLPFYFNPDEGAFLRFGVSGETETRGFCRVAIPKDLLWVEDGWTVYYGSVTLDYTTIPDENYTYLYFTYPHYGKSTTTVAIIGTHVIPEFPSVMILPLLMTIAMLTVVFTKKKIYWKKLET